MRATVIGVGQVMEGISKKTGKPYKFQIVHIAMTKAGVDGRAVKEQFVDFLSIPNAEQPYKVADVLSIDYDDTGALQGIEVVQHAQTKPVAPRPSAATREG